MLEKEKRRTFQNEPEGWGGSSSFPKTRRPNRNAPPCEWMGRLFPTYVGTAKRTRA
jgi:hypothetical protein